MTNDPPLEAVRGLIRTLDGAPDELRDWVRRLEASPRTPDVPPAPVRAVLPEGDRALFEQLREWRRLEAKKAGCAPYVVAHDTKLMAVAAARPNSLEKLAEIFGHRRTDRYGPALLEVIAKHG